MEILSHYGNEHFCPISLFRAYGTSEVEEIEDADNGDTDDNDNEDDGTNMDPQAANAGEEDRWA